MVYKQAWSIKNYRYIWDVSVSPVICNMRVTKMLVDGGVGLNLISVKLMENLQISTKELAPTGVF
jgi:hypothetical protein